MKLAIFYLGLVFLISCSPSEEEFNPTETYRVERNSMFRYFVGNNPTEGEIKILKHPNYFDRSEISYEDNGVYYIFIPKEDYTGNEIVSIERIDNIGNTDGTTVNIILKLIVE